MICNLKINILTSLKNNPWGGGNQFLKNLKSEFIRKSAYAENPAEADAIIFNSYQELITAIRLKIKYPTKRFVHRLGPIFFYHRGQKWKFMDKLILKISSKISDYTIFQSAWSLQESKKLGFQNTPFSVIPNTADSSIFYFTSTKPANKKIKLISASWSPNPNKGLDFFSFLDENLDFSKFELTLIGNFPLKFKNITILPSTNQQEIAAHLRLSDIFLSPTKHEACSNAILEAIACRLPVVALDSGGNKELIQNRGELFKDEKEFITKIDLVSKNLPRYQSNIKIKNLSEITDEYLKAAASTLSLPTKKTGLFFLLKTKILLKIFSIYRRL